MEAASTVFSGVTFSEYFKMQTNSTRVTRCGVLVCNMAERLIYCSLSVCLSVSITVCLSPSLSFFLIYARARIHKNKIVLQSVSSQSSLTIWRELVVSANLKGNTTPTFTPGKFNFDLIGGHTYSVPATLFGNNTVVCPFCILDCLCSPNAFPLHCLSKLRCVLNETLHFL